MKRSRRLSHDTDIIGFLKGLSPEVRCRAIELLNETEREALDRTWAGWAHAGQLPPAKGADGTAWSTWVIMAGRGFGKTLAGAQWITARIAASAKAARPIRIALVGATVEDARRVMCVKSVHARVGKSHRAEPVAHLFEAGRVRLHGRMAELEAQLLGMIAGGGYEGPGASPDRADAMVWGVGELMRVRAEVRVRAI